MPLVRPWLGVRFQGVTADLGDSLGLARPVGVLITEVEPGSPADRAGLGNGDVVLSVNGQPVNDGQALRFRIATLTIGAQAGLLVWRNGERREVPFDVIAPPEDPPRNVTELSGRHPLAGAVVANLSPALLAEIDYEGRVRRGVIVLDVLVPSRAHRLGVRPMDVISRLDGRPMDLVETMQSHMARSRAPWTIEVNRDGGTLQATVSR